MHTDQQAEPPMPTCQGLTCDCAHVRPSETTSARCLPRASTATLRSSSPWRRIWRTSAVQHTSRGNDRSKDLGLHNHEGVEIVGRPWMLMQLQLSQATCALCGCKSSNAVESTAEHNVAKHTDCNKTECVSQ